VSDASRPSPRASKLPVEQLVFVARGAFSWSTPCVCALRGFLPGRVSPTGLPGDTVWLALPPTGWGGLSVLSQRCHASVCYSVNLPPCGELLAWCVNPALRTLSCVAALIRILICSHSKASWACNGRFFSLTEARMGSSVAAFCRIVASGDYRLVLHMSLFKESAEVEAPRGMASCGPSAPNDTTLPYPPPSSSPREPTPPPRLFCA